VTLQQQKPRMDTRSPVAATRQRVPVAAVIVGAVIGATLALTSVGIWGSGFGAGIELTRGDVLEQLVGLGYLPTEAIETGDLHTPRERATLDAVRQGQVPVQALDSETLVLKGLIDRLAPADTP
jgi:hypothetical protein